MRAVYLTAGAAGMYCGSCMHDNALARALLDQGVDCLLQPVYTPIRTDSQSVADERVFFGGIHIYLMQRMPWLHRIPAPLRRALDWPPLIRMVTRRAFSTDATKLGQLTVSMLNGSEGRQADEVRRLVLWLADEIKPQAVLLSNLLIGGALPEIRKHLPGARLIVLLQGDDLFLDFLPDAAKNQAIERCRALVNSVDRFVVHSYFYAEKMGRLFQIPDEKMFVTPLSIDTKPFHDTSQIADRPHDQFRLGYLARVAPEKGLHQLVDSFLRLAQHEDHQDLTLHVAGWLGHSNEDYLQQQQAKIEAAALSHRFTYHGSPTLQQKVAFLQSLDLLCVPTDYADPKGLFVLEALAAGVPVVQPDHGAFRELVMATGGGVLVPPGDLTALCDAITDLKLDRVRRQILAEAGQANVHINHSIEQAAERMRAIMFE